MTTDRGVIIIFLTFCLSCHLYGQDPRLQGGSTGKIALTELFGALEKEYGFKFFYRPEWIEKLRGEWTEKDDIEQLLGTVLKGTGLGFYREGKEIYLYPGSSVISELPDFEYPREPEQDTITMEQEPQGEKDHYLQTKKISEANFITVGSAGKPITGGKCRVKGRITNWRSGEALVGATVFIEELGTGIITDAEGRFEVELPPGQYTIMVQHMAMKETRFGLNVLSAGEVRLELEDELIELEEVTVSDQRHSNLQGILMGFERISTQAMKEIPVVLGEKDILQVAQMLPGVQTAGEGTSGFNVRGGTADQNMFYINRVPVYNTSHLFGFFTAFSPDVVSDFSLYKNNVPSKYGGRIASIFDISTRQGNSSNFFAQGGISPVTAHVSMEGPILKEKVSFVTSWRNTYSDWLLQRVEEPDIRESSAYFYDGTFGINASINPDNQLKAFAYLSNDRFSLSSKNDYRYSTAGGSFQWKHHFSPSFTADFSLSGSQYKFRNIDMNNHTEAFIHEFQINHNEFRMDFLSVSLERHRIEFGASGIYYNLDRGDIMPYGKASNRKPVDLGSDYGMESAVYLSDEFSLATRLFLRMGLRYSYYGQLGPAEVNSYEEGLPMNKFTRLGTSSYRAGELVQSYSGFEPRLALNYRLTRNSSLKASYNRLRQYIFLLSNTYAIAPTDQWKLTGSHISPPVADQVSAGFYYDFEDAGISTSVEVYKKWVNDIVEYKDGADFISPDPIETQILQGSQDVRGVEFMMRKNTRRITGWLSYSYSRSTVQVNGKYAEEKINRGVAYPSNSDRPHSLDLVSNYRLSRRFSVSANVVYSTGRPITLPIAVYYAEEQEYLYYSDRNEYRIPGYFRVDLSVNLEGNLKFKKIAHSYWMLNIYNVTGRDNAYSVFYEAKEGQIRGYKLSIFAQPIVTLSWNFKLGNYNSD